MPLLMSQYIFRRARELFDTPLACHADIYAIACYVFIAAAAIFAAMPLAMPRFTPPMIDAFAAADDYAAAAYSSPPVTLRAADLSPPLLLRAASRSAQRQVASAVQRHDEMSLR